MKNAGENFDLSEINLLKELSNSRSAYNTDKILFINNDYDNGRFAIIALIWNGKPRLAIRWFHDRYGFPHNGNNASWFIIPPCLNDSIIKTLEENVSQEKKCSINVFFTFEGIINFFN